MRNRLISALSDIINTRGADFLTENVKMTANILLDMVPEAEKERRRIKQTLSSDAMDIIYSVSDNISDAEMLVNKAVKCLADETDWSEDIARDTLLILMSAIYPDIQLDTMSAPAPKPQNGAPVITASPTTQSIVYEYNDDDYTRMWSLEFKPIKGDSYAIARYSAFEKENTIILPTSYKGKPVTQISDRAFKNADIAEIIMPDSIIKIGNSAFEDTGITECTIPDSVIEIGNSAFANCNKLKKIHLSSELRKIGSSAFDNTRINKLLLPSHLGEIDIKTISSINEIAFTSRNTVIRFEKVAQAHRALNYSYIQTPGDYVYWDGTNYRECGKPNEKGEVLVLQNLKWKFYCLPGSQSFHFAQKWGITCRPLTEYKE